MSQEHPYENVCVGLSNVFVEKGTRLPEVKLFIWDVFRAVCPLESCRISVLQNNIVCLSILFQKNTLKNKIHVVMGEWMTKAATSFHLPECNFTVRYSRELVDAWAIYYTMKFILDNIFQQCLKCEIIFLWRNKFWVTLVTPIRLLQIKLAQCWIPSINTINRTTQI